MKNLTIRIKFIISWLLDEKCYHCIKSPYSLPFFLRLFFLLSTRYVTLLIEISSYVSPIGDPILSDILFPALILSYFEGEEEVDVSIQVFFSYAGKM